MSCSKSKKTRIYQKSLSVSITMSKSEPTSPTADKKNVHFADAEGKDLVNVKTFVPSYDDLDALRKVFMSNVSLQERKNLQNGEENTEDDTDPPENEVRRFGKLKGSTTLLTARKTLVQHTFNQEVDCLTTCYDQLQPGEIEERIKMQEICLADTRLNGRTVNGFITVNNLAYHKDVSIRHTFDDWKTVREVPAYYISSFEDGARDRFGFSLPFPTKVTEMHFALRYSVNGKEYWDNNCGNNYKIVDFS